MNRLLSAIGKFLLSLPIVPFRLIVVAVLLLLAPFLFLWYLFNPLSPTLRPPLSPPSPTPTIMGVVPILLSPQPGETLVGPLVIKGYVPKSWVFEGQFQMKLLDNKRRLIVQGRVPVEWDGDNKKDPLYFVESYNYRTSAESGFLVLGNDNPSGLPENQKSYEIAVKFATPSPGTVYLFNLGSGDPEIDNQCQIVLPRAVNIGASQTPVKDTLNRLAKSMHTDFYVKSVNLKNGLLTIEFPPIPGFTTGGSCAQGLNFLKVTKTALQFPEVRQVRIIPDSIFQP